MNCNYFLPSFSFSPEISITECLYLDIQSFIHFFKRKKVNCLC